MCMKNIKSAAALLILTGTFLFTGEAAAQYRRDLASIPMQDEAQDGTVQSAEQSASRTWTLHDCMQYAVNHSPEMRLQQAVQR